MTPLKSIIVPHVFLARGAARGCHLMGLHCQMQTTSGEVHQRRLENFWLASQLEGGQAGKRYSQTIDATARA
jgi:hypothetical protein